MCILKYHSLGKTRRISSFSFTVIEEIFLEIRERYEGGDIIEQDACNDESIREMFGCSLRHHNAGRSRSFSLCKL